MSTYNFEHGHFLGLGTKSILIVGINHLNWTEKLIGFWNEIFANYILNKHYSTAIHTGEYEMFYKVLVHNMQNWKEAYILLIMS